MDNHGSGVETEIREAVAEYLRVYFTERSYERLVAMMHPDVNGFGTGADEVAREPLIDSPLRQKRIFFRPAAKGRS